MNKVILLGRLTKDPEMRYTTTGKAICSITVAVNRRYSKDAEQKADFIPCQAWEKLAEIIGNNLVKGSQLLLEGRLQIRSYDGQDGKKRYVTEVIISDVEFVGKKSDGKSSQNDAGGFGGQESNEDIPF